MTKGRIYGSEVKKDSTLANNVIYFGYPKSLQANDFEQINVMNDVDVRTASAPIAAMPLSMPVCATLPDS